MSQLGLHHDLGGVSRLDGDRWRFEVRLPRAVKLSRLELFVDQRGNHPWVRMTRRRGRRLDRYLTEVELPRGRVSYRFRYRGETGRGYFDAGGEVPYRPATPTSFAFHTCEQPPEWVRDQVFYQIFPDRFRRGGGATASVRLPDPGPGGKPGLARRWGDLPRRSHGAREFFGGDLDGITEALDGLLELGVTALYLNPIFDSPTNHRYDTRDYHKVDPVLGGEAAYHRLVDALRERGMRLILDGVFNHTGDQIEWFDPQLAGPRGHWYTPGPAGGYMSWWGVSSLPKLDFAEPEVVEAMYAGRDSVVRRWLRGPRGADGWRLDTAACHGEGGSARGNLRHLRGILEAARAERPDAYVIGEVFDPAGAWLDQGALHAVMNYSGFGLPLVEWLGGEDHEGGAVAMDGRTLWQAWSAHLAGRTHAERLAAFNVVGSHDTPRVRTRVGGSPARSLVAHAVLFAFPGTPCVYYGDEVGLEGGDDPDCRRCFPWEPGDWNTDLREGVRRLAAMRRGSRALREGGLRLLVADGNLIGFARQHGEEVALLLANRGRGPRRLRLDLSQLGLSGERLVDGLGGGSFTLRGGVLTVKVPGERALLLQEPG